MGIWDLMTSYAIPRSKSESLDRPSLKSTMMETINDLEEEVLGIHTSIARSAPDYIHDGDIVMAVGRSASLSAFLKRAKQAGRKFSVIIPEGAPSYDGLTMAKSVRSIGISCSVIPDSAVFAVMSRVSTVFSSACAVFGDGTLLTRSYVKPIMLAAKYHSKPFIALYWTNKLVDRFIKPNDVFTDLGNPRDIVPLDDIVAQNATVLNPDGEWLSCSGSSVTLLINEDKEHDPNDIFSVLESRWD
jgi:translation initiation factor eIF-2B subunit beta